MIEEFLETKILVNDYIYLDLWSMVHFSVGYMLWSYFKLKPIHAVILIVLYEIIEMSTKWFRPESTLDRLWDVIIGILGYIIAIRQASVPCLSGAGVFLT